MADQTSLYNLTLLRLGVSQPVTAPSENSVPAKTLSRIYDQCRREVLRAFPWGYATKAEALAVVSGQTFPGWTYVYQYPSGCLNMRAVCDEGGIRSTYSAVSACESLPAIRRRWPFQLAIKDDGASQVILSDVGSAWGIYTRDITNLGAWPDDAISVLSWRMAMEGGGGIQARADLIANAATMYGIFQSQAAAASMNEQKDDPQAEPESIACRY